MKIFVDSAWFCIAYVFILAFGLAGVAAAESNAEQARKILEQALAKEDQFTLSAIIQSGGEAFPFHRKVNPDGTTYERADYGESGLYKYLKNREGVFTLHKTSITNQAIKAAYEFPPGVNYDQFATFAVKDGNYNGHPCHIVTRTVRDSPVTYAHWLNNDKLIDKKKRDAESLKSLFSAYFKALSVYYIDKANGFIYLAGHYSSNGKLLAKDGYQPDSLVFNPDFPEDFFDLPNDVKIVIASSSGESPEIMRQAIYDNHQARIKRRNAGPGAKERLLSFINRNMDGIMTWGTYLFCAIGVISVLLLIHHKRPKKS